MNEQFGEGQEVPRIQSTPYASPMYNYGGSIVHLTDPDRELYKMELTLRGKYMGIDGKPVGSGEPLMNEVGINAMMGLVQSVVNQVTIMSNLDKQEVSKLILFEADTLSRDLMVNTIHYGIKSKSARDKIYFSVLMTSFICMKRAFEEGDRRFWKGSQQEITTRIEGGKKSAGTFEKILGWGKTK